MQLIWCRALWWQKFLASIIFYLQPTWLNQGLKVISYQCNGAGKKFLPSNREFDHEVGPFPLPAAEAAAGAAVEAAAGGGGGGGGGYWTAAAAAGYECDPPMAGRKKKRRRKTRM